MLKKTDITHVIYDKNTWQILRILREKARKILSILNSYNIEAYVIGSVARGDVNKNSDVDIVIPNPYSPYFIEDIILRSCLPIYYKEIVMATPSSVIKVNIYIEEKVCISFPLVSLSDLEREFLKYCGSISYSDIVLGKRIAGVNKKLCLIIPTIYGHISYPVLLNKKTVANILDVSLSIIQERTQMLLRRARIGRTGLYLREIIPPEVSIEKVIKTLSQKDPILKNRLRNFL